MYMITKSTLSKLIEMNIPVLLTGHPGVGKTYTIHQIGQELGYTVITVITSLHDPTDFGGMPVISDDGVRFVPPRWAVEMATDGPTILFFDEIDKAAPAVQAAALRIVQERVVGDIALGDQVRIVAASNPPQYGGWSLIGPLVNRFCLINWAPTPTECADGLMEAALARECEPRVKEQIGKIAPIVGAFIRHTGLSFSPDRETAMSGEQFATPRGLEQAVYWLANEAANGGDTNLEQRNLALIGFVGQGVGLQLAGYLSEMELPDPEELIASPDGKIDIPKRLDKIGALVNSVAIAVELNPTAKRYEAAVHVIGRIADDCGEQDVAIPALMRLMEISRKKKYSIPKEMEKYASLLRGAKILKDAGEDNA